MSCDCKGRAYPDEFVSLMSVHTKPGQLGQRIPTWLGQLVLVKLKTEIAEVGEEGDCT